MEVISYIYITYIFKLISCLIINEYYLWIIYWIPNYTIKSISTKKQSFTYRNPPPPENKTNSDHHHQVTRKDTVCWITKRNNTNFGVWMSGSWEQCHLRSTRDFTCSLLWVQIHQPRSFVFHGFLAVPFLASIPSSAIAKDY